MRPKLAARLAAAVAARRQPDRGSVSIWVLIFAFVTIALLILVVDGGEVMLAKSRAADIAEQAARAAANDLNRAQLQNGHVVIDTNACSGAGPAATLIADYAKGVGVTAQMQNCQPATGPGGQPGREVWVSVQMTPAIPASLFGSINVTSHEVAYLQCGNAQQAQAC
jgi:Flp pilus assembly protein TadG